MTIEAVIVSWIVGIGLITLASAMVWLECEYRGYRKRREEILRGNCGAKLLNNSTTSSMRHHVHRRCL